MKMPAKQNATKPATPPVSPTSAVVDATETEWELVREESPDKVIFEDIGDVLIGRFVGRETVEIEATDKEPASQFTVLTWRDVLYNGDPYDYVANNAGYALETAFAKLPLGVTTRVTLVKKTDVGQASKMNDFRVEVARTSANNPG